MQGEINVQVEKSLKNIKRAGQNRRAGGIFFSEISINVQVEINVQGDFIFKILKKVQDFVHTLVLLLIDINLSNVMNYYLAARVLLTLKYKSHLLLCDACKKK